MRSLSTISIPVALAIALAPAGCTSSSRVELPPAPWSSAKIAEREAPVIVEEWRRSENRSSCAPIMFASLGEGTGATPRRAFFSGGWGVAWDKAGLRGKDSSGNPCSNCGRSAFGIAGTGATATADRYRWPAGARYSDGSLASWGPEGGSGPGWLAYVEVAGQKCLYNVWSNVSASHLRQLVDAMRFVEVKGE